MTIKNGNSNHEQVANGDVAIEKTAYDLAMEELAELDKLNTFERLRVMREKGWPQVTGTRRIVRLKNLEPHVLLKEGKMPDILTPLLVKSLYAENPDILVGDFLEQPINPDEALDYIDMIDTVCRKGIVDTTNFDELTLREKKIIFRLILGSAEMLVNFRFKPQEQTSPVADMAQSDNVPPITVGNLRGDRPDIGVDVRQRNSVLWDASGKSSQ